MRAKEDGLYLCAEYREFPSHLAMYGIDGIDAEVTTTQARLVCCHDNSVSCVVESGDCFEAAWNGYPLLGCFYVVVGILIDDAVPVEDYELGALCISVHRRNTVQRLD